MSWFWRVRPSGPLRLLGPLVARLGQRQEERIWTGLKNHLEDLARPAPQQSSDHTVMGLGDGLDTSHWTRG
jgi:hypothetical protein